MGVGRGGMSWQATPVRAAGGGGGGGEGGRGAGRKWRGMSA